MCISRSLSKDLLLQQKQSTSYKTFAQEIDQVLMAIRNDECNVNNYLYAAKLYSCQGKQQDAISILKRCLSCLVPEQEVDNMDSNIIRDQMGLIQAQLVRRIDFVAHCPYEIICNIIDRLGQNTAIECLKVCRAWRRTLLSYPPIWRNIYIGTDERKITLSDQKEILKPPHSITKYIETLYISSSMYPACSQVLMSLTKYSFDNLKILAISDKGIWDKLIKNPFYLALPYIGQTLTELDLDGRSYIDISLEQVLRTCLNLTAIKLSVLNVHDNPITGIEIPNTTLLTRIEIASVITIPARIIKSLLRNSPKCRYLALRFRIRNGILDVLGDYCPELADIRSLIVRRTYNNEFDDDGGNHDTMAKYIPNPIMTVNSVEPKGALRCLQLQHIQSALPLKSRLAKSCHTLQAISLVMDQPMDNTTVHDWEPFSSFTWYTLSYLHIWNGRQAFYQQLPAMLRRCPALKHLHLQNSRIIEEPIEREGQNDADILKNEIFDTIEQLDHISELILNGVDVTGPGFDRLLNTLQQKNDMEDMNTVNGIGQTSNKGDRVLKRLGILDCKGVTNHILKQITKIKNMQRLAISCWGNHTLSKTDFEEFIRTVVDKMTRLLWLELDFMPLTTNSVQYIINCKELKNLTLGRKIHYCKQKRVIKKMLKDSDIEIVNWNSDIRFTQ
ncbi:hypothetical protein INT45_007584 [Circinella minor]|uniref:F-box domain-containing protein n=1 Tax=Circinella minor TaxID=1195481 RepID=A0A8H7S625_9FUNG|nr:hypothetical protein INT45_007584 [Circinella minor]